MSLELIVNLLIKKFGKIFEVMLEDFMVKMQNFEVRLQKFEFIIHTILRLCPFEFFYQFKLGYKFFRLKFLNF